MVGYDGTIEFRRYWQVVESWMTWETEPQTDGNLDKQGTWCVALDLRSMRSEIWKLWTASHGTRTILQLSWLSSNGWAGLSINRPWTPRKFASDCGHKFSNLVELCGTTFSLMSSISWWNGCACRPRNLSISLWSYATLGYKTMTFGLQMVPGEAKVNRTFPDDLKVQWLVPTGHISRFLADNYQSP